MSGIKELDKNKYCSMDIYYSNLKDEKIIGMLYEKELQKTNQEEFRIEKVIKKKGDELYVKWKGYDNLFNSWIDKRDIV